MRRKEVGGWICEVEVMVTEVQEILQKVIKKSRRDVSDAVPGIVGLATRWEGTEMLPRPLVDELPMEETVGSELAYGRICGFLKDPQVGIMGLYGMGVWAKPPS
ncbi:hypothetical protein CK203_043014 [Vitis vinifera]|uniref:Uncharacterized protein n=1 Tax=Vitis vinifera TaxID=29760 RepID=A0A438GZP2_VITVI|nr:hypothetical protein CK203_043014 [Vitis vinifera]